jgi:hypothetical protein
MATKTRRRRQPPPAAAADHHQEKGAKKVGLIFCESSAFTKLDILW